jgi:hypothetical protein
MDIERLGKLVKKNGLKLNKTGSYDTSGCYVCSTWGCTLKICSSCNVKSCNKVCIEGICNAVMANAYVPDPNDPYA